MSVMKMMKVMSVRSAEQFPSIFQLLTGIVAHNFVI
jgi:hypothetical protein